MSYEYPIQISAMFEAHGENMAHFGISSKDIAEM
jgi:hypothetical protein